jgi:hypothetical protein
VGILVNILRQQPPLCLVVSYQVGDRNRGPKLIYKQHKQHIQTHDLGLDVEPRDLFRKDLVRAISEWLDQVERVLLFIDMNKHILTGVLPTALQNLGLVEATHTRWQEGSEPNTYINGSAPIDGAYHSPELEVTAVTQLSFHDGFGDHRTVLVDITTRSVIGQQEYRIVRPAVHKITTRNKESTKNYLKDMAKQFEMHHLVPCQKAIATTIKEGMSSTQPPRMP